MRELAVVQPAHRPDLPSYGAKPTLGVRSKTLITVKLRFKIGDALEVNYFDAQDWILPQRIHQ